MNILLAYVVSVLASYGMELIYTVRLYKDLADNGKTMNIKNLKKAANIINNSNVNNKIMRFIPGINILYEAYLYNAYNSKFDELCNELESYGCIVDMTPEEKEAYAIKSTGLNAVKICLNTNKKKQDAEVQKIIVHHNDSDSSYEFNMENDEINIIRSSGKYTSLPLDEQKDILLRTTLFTSQSIGDKELEEKHGIRVGGTEDNLIIEVNDSIYTCEEMKVNDDLIDELNELRRKAEEAKDDYNSSVDDDKKIDNIMELYDEAMNPKEKTKSKKLVYKKKK